MAKTKAPAAAKDAADAPTVPVGKKAPAFNLKDQSLTGHRLSGYAGQWVVVYFYPKDATPGCTTEACDFRDQHTVLTNAGAVVLGVSPDDEDSHRKFADKQKLPFPLLADHDAKVCTKYGVWQEKSMYGRKFMGVVRTTYLIDPSGKVAHRWDKVKVKGHVDDVLATLDSLQNS